MRLSVALYSRDLIAEGTKDKASEVIGISKYQKNAEIMNEAEKVIKYDKTGSKFIALCEVLQEMELVKEYGDRMMEEAGLSGSGHIPTHTHTYLVYRVHPVYIAIVTMVYQQVEIQ